MGGGRGGYTDLVKFCLVFLVSQENLISMNYFFLIWIVLHGIHFNFIFFHEIIALSVRSIQYKGGDEEKKKKTLERIL